MIAQKFKSWRLRPIFWISVLFILDFGMRKFHTYVKQYLDFPHNMFQSAFDKSV